MTAKERTILAKRIAKLCRQRLREKDAKIRQALQARIEYMFRTTRRKTPWKR
jgi:hypothetical protein